MNHTTRRYPRTLHEAFPRDRQWAYAIERHTPVRDALLDVALAAAIGIGLALALVHWWAS